ncbi:hypothetical protein [Jannaschia sp. CCS1]|nr:hypothetical protein [Jannaschia sp. CCS1]
MQIIRRQAPTDDLSPDVIDVAHTEARWCGGAFAGRPVFARTICG